MSDKGESMEPTQKGNAEVDLSQISTVQTEEYQPSSKIKRVIAFILDLILVAVLQQLIILFISPPEQEASMLLNTVLWVFMAFAYWTLLTLKYGGTPGKILLGLRIVHADRSKKLSIGQMMLRETIGRTASILPLFLGYLWIFWDKERRTFHDMIAKTRVIDYKR